MQNDILGEAWNDEIYEDLVPPNYSSVVVYSRDWTVETIVQQIRQGNIDLNPRFQRRNAWNDEKRSRLIESLVIGVPVPEIVLAESRDKRKSFLVIDGKQRLLTIWGFVDPDVNYWDEACLRKLKSRADLNKVTFDMLQQDADLSDDLRSFLNADIRCTVVSNYDSDEILYDIFYRINTGSVPLSTQELRQVLNQGRFAEVLIEHTSDIRPLHRVLKLNEPDTRLRDVELVLRSLSLELFGHQYRGNLKDFLDFSMRTITQNWPRYEEHVMCLLEEFDLATQRAIDVLGAEKVGRKYTDGKWETRFNRSIFEAQIYYYRRVPDEALECDGAKRQFIHGYQELCSDSRFRSAVESTTKTVRNYYVRFDSMRKLINASFGLDIDDVPVNIVE